jgi:hypothetical protein
MRTRLTLLLILLVLVFLIIGAGALSVPCYQVEAGTIVGGGYQLTSSWLQPDNVSAGGAYRLLGPSAPNLRGSGCCCTHMPCILRNK